MTRRHPKQAVQQLCRSACPSTLRNLIEQRKTQGLDSPQHQRRLRVPLINVDGQHLWQEIHTRQGKSQACDSLGVSLNLGLILSVRHAGSAGAWRSLIRASQVRYGVNSPAELGCISLHGHCDHRQALATCSTSVMSVMLLGS